MIERLRAQMQAMQMLSKAQEVTADNLANINTPGFKGSKVFYHLLKQEVNGRELSRAVQQQSISLKQGELEHTGNAFDIGIKGKGFFVVEAGGKSYLSRNGRFNINSNGYLIDSQGSKVMGTAGPVYIPEYLQASGDNKASVKLEVASDGTIRLNNKVYDRLRLVKVDDPSHLERRGNSYFSAAPNSALAGDGESTVMQGFYEKGNVEPLNEMVDMMRTKDMFESQQRVIRSTDEMLRKVTSNLGKF